MSALSTTLDNWWQDCLATLPSQNIHSGQSYFDSEPAFTALSTIAAIHPLHQLGLISIEGPDASRFLQGQLTGDLDALACGDTVLAAHCDPKGRMHSNFFLHCISETHYLLQLPLTVVSTALNALKKYAVFSKATLTDISTQYAAFGFANTHSEVQHPDMLVSLTINTIGSVQWIKRTSVNSYISKLEALDAQWCGSAAWEYRLINAGIGFVQTETIGEFIPQMFNLDYLNGISFTKGCYTGQEIIARMKYRGKVKRRCYPFVATAINNTISIGADLLNDEGKLIGTVVSVARDIKHTTTEKTYGLAVIKVDAAEQKSLSVKSDTALTSTALTIKALTITTLPYDINNNDDK